MLDQKDGLKEAYEATVFVYVIHNFFEIIVILSSLNMYLIYRHTDFGWFCIIIAFAIFE